MSFEKGKEKLKKGKQGFFRLLFSRLVICLLLVALQVWFLVSVTIRLNQYFMPMMIVSYVLSIVILIYILNKDNMNPAFKMVWMIPIVGLPIIGVAMYFLLQSQPQQRAIRHRLRETMLYSSTYVKQDSAVMNRLREENGEVAGVATYLSNCAFPVYGNTNTEYYPSGEIAFESMKEAIRSAEKFIFLEYFILSEGRMLGEILDLLEEKVKQGVEVRFIYDGMCSLTSLPYGYSKKIRARGIKCCIFAPVVPTLSTYQNNRDHRKIMVIDNRIAFTGGINLADEYINDIVRFGYWKDNAIKLEGDAVRSFTIMFLQMWDMLDRETTEYEPYLTPYSKSFAKNTGYAIPYADSPLDDEPTGELIYRSVLAHAKRYVHIMTPYLVMDNELLTELKFTAKKGVDVAIMMPHIPDKKYAFWLAKTYYAELISAGVKIYEFVPGFVHSKVFVSDDETAVVGTINLDFRSLYLHYECAVYLHQSPAVSQVEADFSEALKDCVEITMEDCDKRSLPVRFVGQVLRLIAPLM